MAFTIEFENLQNLRIDLEQISDRAKNIPALMDAAGTYMVNTEVPLIFRDQGPGWLPTLRSTRSGGQILRDTGALAGSMEYTVNGNTLTVFTNLKYAPVHQYGATITAKGGKFLAIPDIRLPKAAQRNFDLRGYPNTFAKPSGNGY